MYKGCLPIYFIFQFYCDIASFIHFNHNIWSFSLAESFLYSKTTAAKKLTGSRLKYRRIVETCIYSSDLETMKDFYTNALGLEVISEEKGRHVFLKAGKSMLLIFNPENTRAGGNSKFPVHGATTPPACIHFALEIEKEDYKDSKNALMQNNVNIEKEMDWDKEGSKSIYFRDPVGNLVEFITKDNWPVEE